MTNPMIQDNGVVREMTDAEAASLAASVAPEAARVAALHGAAIFNQSIRRQADALRAAGKPVDAFLLLQSKGLLT